MDWIVFFRKRIEYRRYVYCLRGRFAVPCWTVKSIRIWTCWRSRGNCFWPNRRICCRCRRLIRPSWMWYFSASPRTAWPSRCRRVWRRSTHRRNANVKQKIPVITISPIKAVRPSKCKSKGKKKTVRAYNTPIVILRILGLTWAKLAEMTRATANKILQAAIVCRVGLLLGDLDRNKKKKFMTKPVDLLSTPACVFGRYWLGVPDALFIYTDRARPPDRAPGRTRGSDEIIVERFGPLVPVRVRVHPAISPFVH